MSPTGGHDDAGRPGTSGEPDVTAAPFVVLRGDGLVLRCLRQRDVPELLAAEDEDTVRWLQEGHRSELRRTRQWVGESQRQWLDGGPRRSLGVFDAGGEVLLGTAEAHLTLLGEGRGVNLSYSVSPPWRGRGVAARAVQLLCGWLVSDAPTTERAAVLRIARGNAPSHGVARAAGFTPCGPEPSAGAGAEPLDRYERPLR